MICPHVTFASGRAALAWLEPAPRTRPVLQVCPDNRVRTSLQTDHRQVWRNGRRGGFKIRFPKGSVGSIPTTCTNKWHAFHAPTADRQTCVVATLGACQISHICASPGPQRTGNWHPQSSVRQPARGKEVVSMLLPLRWDAVMTRAKRVLK